MFELFAAVATLAVIAYAFGLMVCAGPRRPNRAVRRLLRWVGRRLWAAIAWVWQWFWYAVWWIARQIGHAVWYLMRQAGRGFAALVRFCWTNWPWQTAAGIAIIMIALSVAGAIYIWR